MEDYLKIIIPTAISLVAAIFSILTYRRNRRFDNENYIYKTKHESYAKILGEMNKCINTLQDYIFDFKEYIHYRNSTKLSDEELDKLDDKIDDLADNTDDLIYHFDDIVISNSLVIPKEVLTKLERFTEKLFEGELPESIDENYNDMLTKLDKHISVLINDANIISGLLRDDLNIESLNSSLYRRLKN